MLALTGAVAVLALAGCGSGGGESEVPATATGSLEHLAAEVKCKPNMQTDADTIRQAICKTGKEKYVLATFATDRGQREWIDMAKDYGGFYLVGRKWVAVGEENVLDDLRGRLGGDVEEGIDHSSMNHGGGAHPSGRAGEKTGGHSGH
ncbi:lipoprotein [Streptomyces chlorus]